MGRLLGCTPTMPEYEIVRDERGDEGIRCLRCGGTTWSPPGHPRPDGCLRCSSAIAAERAQAVKEQIECHDTARKNSELTRQAAMGGGTVVALWLAYRLLSALVRDSRSDRK